MQAACWSEQREHERGQVLRMKPGFSSHCSSIAHAQQEVCLSSQHGPTPVHLGRGRARGRGRGRGKGRGRGRGRMALPLARALAFTLALT